MFNFLVNHTNLIIHSDLVNHSNRKDYARNKTKPYIQTTPEGVESYIPVTNSYDAWYHGECDQG